MSDIKQYVGSRIKTLRKEQKLTLQQLADLIHKSRATVSKYENGEISIDVETLQDIAVALDTDVNQLVDYRSKKAPAHFQPREMDGKSPFYQADRLYFYYFDGRSNRLKDGVIDINRKDTDMGQHDASFYINYVTADGRTSKNYYKGKAVYSDMLMRFSFVNQYNTLEEDLLYIFNPLEPRDFTEGLLCGISSADLMPCAFKCIITLAPQPLDDKLKQLLLITPQELRRWQKLNMLIVDNRR
ncbi:MAG: helix-turn-helix transcriptional regulator [Oscillospiraceae bacterium]|nr:helix-turn-helix transcriptional regulator [Oscillospiraceae bacterium]